VKRWWDEIVAVDAALRWLHNVSAHTEPNTDQLGWEILWLALPGPGCDVVIPAGRTDLAARWIEARLAGCPDTGPETIALQRELSPSPDVHSIPYDDRRKRRTRYRSTNRLQDEMTRAVQDHVRSSAQRPALAEDVDIPADFS
jgi:hypothetical protein